MAPNIATWTTPNTVGQLSNTHGSNTSTDAISLQASYFNVNGDSPSGIRVTAIRTKVAGVPTPSPNLMQDSAWVGNPATSALPFTTALSANACVTAFGRVYVLVPPSVTPATNAVFGVISAPVNGGNLGGWRWETPGIVQATDPYGSTYLIQDTVSPGAMQMLSGSPTDHFLYVLGKAGIYSARLGGDGSIGNWTQALAGNTASGAMMGAWGNIPSAGSAGTLFIADNVANGVCEGYQVNTDGTINSSLVFSTNSGTQVGYGAVHIDPQGGTFIIGGETGGGTTPTTTILWNNINYSTNSVSSWGASTAPLPAARSRFGFCYWPNPNNSPDTWVYVCGGTNGTTGQTTVYRAQGSTMRNGGSWTTYTNALPLASSGRAAALSFGYPWPQFGGSIPVTPVPSISANSPWAYDSGVPTQPKASLFVIGGSTTSSVQTSNAGTTTQSWYYGAQATITTGALGGGSAVTVNADGTVAVTFCLADESQGGFGVPKLGALGDGDQVQIGVQFASRTTGDASPMSYTLLKIGQGPSISSVLPSGTITSAQPSLSFVYVPGVGGDVEYSYDIQVKQGSTVIFDTGSRYDSLNSAALAIAPLLAASTSYTLTIQTHSRDNPMSGSVNSAVSTSTFTTSAFTVPAVPTGFTATPSGANANVALAWGAVTGASYYRVYYRRSGTSIWYLYQDNVSGTSLTAMDHIALGVAYDYAVSTVNSLPAESALSTAQTNVTIAPGISSFGTGPYAAWLHVAGQGTTYGLGVQFKTIDLSTTRTEEKIAATPVLGFGQGAPVMRYGTQDYREMQVRIYDFELGTTTLKALQAVMDQVKAGGVAFWRDGLGGMRTIGFGDSQIIAIEGPTFRDIQLKMIEVADTVGPYVVSGVAQGYQTLVNGRKPPLDTSERLL